MTEEQCTHGPCKVCKVADSCSLCFDTCVDCYANASLKVKAATESEARADERAKIVKWLVKCADASSDDADAEAIYWQAANSIAAQRYRHEDK